MLWKRGPLARIVVPAIVVSVVVGAVASRVRGSLGGTTSRSTSRWSAGSWSAQAWKRTRIGESHNTAPVAVDPDDASERWLQAMDLLESLGVQPCWHDYPVPIVAEAKADQNDLVDDSIDVNPWHIPAGTALPLCPESGSGKSRPRSSTWEVPPPLPLRHAVRHRRAQEQAGDAPDNTSTSSCGSSSSNNSDNASPVENESPDELLMNFVGAAVCVGVAALAAGLTLGMLGMDPLMLLIKERASDDPLERQRARQLLPLVQQHHRLLVTLLLMNSIANEALPIFLEALVPPSVAILVSVTLVLFFGEIIPSAVFTGPNQLAIASALVPLVRLALLLLAPIALPIAKLLDCLLHDDSEPESGAAYKRGELSALIRIQYEERLAAKRRRKQRRGEHRHSSFFWQLNQQYHGENVGALDFSHSVPAHKDAIKAVKAHMQYSQSQRSESGDHSVRSATQHPWSEASGGDGRTSGTGSEMMTRSDSLHGDEVVMIEGALRMKTSVAIDVYTPLRQIFAIPETLRLGERAMVQIYASGYSRIPVYRPKADRPKDKTAILGILLSKQLIVLNQSDARAVSSMPLYTPLCVSPQTPLVELVNLFQTGGQALKGGHLALVCARPRVGNEALAHGDPLPEKAGLMGIITLEDVIENLLQEQIYDENDVSACRGTD
jgi:metal transporter CNNM